MALTLEKIHSKLLLFGEHAVVKGSQALAIPFKQFSGKWQVAKPGDAVQELQQNLPAFQHYLSSSNLENLTEAALDTAAFKKDLEGGLYFDANIPVGYGLGSSGALCAAVYHRYAKKVIPPTAVAQFPALKKTLAQMESFFHGSSSGTDPLICYLGQPVIIQPGGKIELANINAQASDNKMCLFLFDTRITRQTGPLVKLFLKNCDDSHYENRVMATLQPANESAITNYLNQNWKALFEDFHEISFFQYKYMSEMIPAAFCQLWLEGLSSKDFKLKICGAGGGGFLLGICTDFSKLPAYFNQDFPDHAILAIP